MGEPFQIVREIGRGATGTVYEVRVPGRLEPMAAKVLEVQTDQARARFEREFKVMSRFRHSNVATAHGFGLTSQGAPYLLFDLIEGGTLEDLLAAEGPLSEERARALLTPVASGLAHAHDLGTTHRDLKPANVLLTASGTPVLTDFGVAQSLELERMTLTGAVVGTPAYMAPEQQRAIPGASVGPRSDVYALGVVLYEALTGELPYASTDPRAKVPELSASLGRIVERCLSEDPSRRFADAGELLRALEGQGRSPKRGWLVAGLGLGILIPLLAAFLWTPGAGPSPPTSPKDTPLTPTQSHPTQSPGPTPTPQLTAWDLELESGARQRGRFRRAMKSAVGAQDLGWEVEQVVTRRGARTLEIRATITRGILTRGDGVVVFDSARPEGNPARFAGMQALIGQSYTIQQDWRTGQVVSVAGGDRLVAILAQQGFPGMNWLSNRSLTGYFTALFGVLPERPLAPGEEWESAPIRAPPVKTRAAVEAAGVRISARETWPKGGGTFTYAGRYRWRDGLLLDSEVEVEEQDPVAGLTSESYRWELLRD